MPGVFGRKVLEKSVEKSMMQFINNTTKSMMYITYNTNDYYYFT